MAWQEDTQEGDAKAQLLAEALEKEGLDAGYWLPKVSQILGIKSREVLQHLEYEDYLKLACEVRHSWEKRALQKLLKITDKVPSINVQQIFEAEHPLPRPPKVTYLEDLIKTLQQMKEHIHAAADAPGSSASAVHEAKRKVTQTSSLTIYSLLQSLQERVQKDMELLVLLITTSTGYQVESSTFQHLHGHPEIQNMVKEMKAAHEEYVNLKEQDADRAEASLLLTGLTVTPESQELSPEQKRERLVFMENHMKGLWSPRVKNLLQKHSAVEDWERLEQNLHSLISGYLDDKWDQQRMQNIFRDLEDTFATPEPPSQSKSKSDRPQSKANEAIANQEFLQLLKRLGLESHYPRKMGMGDFHTIKKTSLQDRQPSKDTELPLYFLQKLLTMDYHL
ncbi:hypothetical protein HGM15179_019438 [Zosterops borbonicus]|uniref:Uncharacterized protein n=1 Tax=Zosterops borbonicus TaxID=364589 RepID=A0A8K1D9D2_9PASS|nr:hypothetical protein HGM15179_019438 [Zosterops borbonicus]